MEAIMVADYYDAFGMAMIVSSTKVSGTKTVG